MSDETCPMCRYPKVNTVEIFPHAYCLNCHRCMLCRSPRPVQQKMFGVDSAFDEITYNL